MRHFNSKALHSSRPLSLITHACSYPWIQLYWNSFVFFKHSFIYSGFGRLFVQILFSSLFFCKSQSKCLFFCIVLSLVRCSFHVFPTSSQNFLYYNSYCALVIVHPWYPCFSPFPCQVDFDFIWGYLSCSLL